MHEHASKMELGDKETVAICIQASVTCYLHVIHHYTRIVRTIRGGPLFHGTERNKLKHYFTERNGTDGIEILSTRAK